jgi:hypothetical protein
MAEAHGSGVSAICIGAGVLASWSGVLESWISAGAIDEGGLKVATSEFVAVVGAGASESCIGAAHGAGASESCNGTGGKDETGLGAHNTGVSASCIGAAGAGSAIIGGGAIGGWGT